MEVALNNSLTVKIRSVKKYDNYIVVDENKERNLFSETWNRIAFNIGIRQKLSDFELKELFDFLLMYFQGLNLADVREAFGLYSANRLTFIVNGKRQTSIGHYQSLDNPFVGNVLTAYLEYKGEITKKPKEIIMEDKQIEVYSEKDGEEWFLFFKQCYENNDSLIFGNWNFSFIYMESKKIIEYSNDEKEMFLEVVVEDLKSQIGFLKMKGKSPSHISSILNDKKSLKLECRKRIVKLFFENGIKN